MFEDAAQRPSEGRRLYAFVDESYQQDHYYIGCMVLDLDQYMDLCERFEDLGRHVAEKYGVDPDIEFHGHPMMQGRKEWQCLRGQVHESVSLYRQAMRHIQAVGARVIIEGVDVARLNARYRYPDPPYEITLRHALEKTNDLTERMGYDSCLVRADMISKHQDFREAIEGYTRVGTPGYKSQRLERIEQPIEWFDSAQERGIQAVDLVVYMYRRTTEVDPGENKRAQRAARTIMRELGPLYSARKWVP
ncbi:DUF3800 domain-containing protein [Kocuria tytonicola]|uniref:DUF3800 domain-containing protein n=1 Tax=Kocuria tytonicola TaxID=2055946 RepID=A0A3L9L473_9MICC|nr:DUF3800 domain-containing protein [Kocuria tytonicola]RLY93773.1 DUF3800 domain-containing protein [Kocuria tytonicola]